MNRPQTTAILSFLAAISSCVNDGADLGGDGSFTHIGSTQSALIIQPPRVDRVQGAICGTAGGCEISIEGSNFRAGFVQLLINNQPASPCRTSTVNKLVCTVPAAIGAKGSVPLEVANDPRNPAKSWLWTDKFFYVDTTVDPWPVRTLRTKGVPLAAAVADLNKDGYPDIAVISEGRDAVEVFLGQPDHRSFLPSVEVAVGKAPSALLTADFNHDGLSDLAVANAMSNDGTMLWSNTGSPYSARTTTLGMVAGTCFQPNSLVSGDQDNDGYPELVMGCIGSSTAIAYLNSAGNLDWADRSDNPAGVRNIRLAHANGADHLLDLITLGGPTNATEVRLAKPRTWLQFENSGALATALTGRSISAIATADVVGGDARIDLVALDAKDKELWILPSLATDNYFSIKGDKLKVRDEYKKVEAIDVNNDGHLDLVAMVGPSNTADIYTAKPAGGFTKHQELSFGFAVPHAELGDVNADHFPDLLLLGADTPFSSEDDDGKAIHIVLNQGGVFRVPESIAVGANPTALLAANLDADAESELVALSRAGTVTVLDEELAGGFSARPKVDLKDLGKLVQADAMALSADRKTLAVLHSDADKFSILTNDGKGSFTVDRFYDALEKPDRSKYIPSDISMGDFVSGGAEEILISFWDESPPLLTPAAGFLASYQWTKMGWKGSKLLSSIGQEPLGLSLTHLAKTPVGCFVNSSSNTIGYWKYTNKPESLETGRYPTALVSCELDGSGAMDTQQALISADTADNTVTVQRRNPISTKFVRLPALAVCAQPTALWCGDVNMDKVADLIVACNGDGSAPPVVELYYGGANGSFLREQSRMPRPGRGGPIAVLAGSTGLRSIVAADESSGTTWAISAQK